MGPRSKPVCRSNDRALRCPAYRCANTFWHCGNRCRSGCVQQGSCSGIRRRSHTGSDDLPHCTGPPGFLLANPPDITAGPTFLSTLHTPEMRPRPRPRGHRHPLQLWSHDPILVPKSPTHLGPPLELPASSAAIKLEAATAPTHDQCTKPQTMTPQVQHRRSQSRIPFLRCRTLVPSLAMHVHRNWRTQTTPSNAYIQEEDRPTRWRSVHQPAALSPLSPGGNFNCPSTTPDVSGP